MDNAKLVRIAGDLADLLEMFHQLGPQEMKRVAKALEHHAQIRAREQGMEPPRFEPQEAGLN